MAPSEKLCLRWDDFAANLSNALYDLKEDKDFTDLTLVCADHQQVDVHKVVMASSSHFFKKVLKNIKHNHPLIYLRDIKITDMEALLSFMYYGQVSLAKENLNSFLAIAEELKVKGLTSGKNSSVGNRQPPVTANFVPKNGPSDPDLQEHNARYLSSTSTDGYQYAPCAQSENMELESQNNNIAEGAPQIKQEQEFLKMEEALHVKDNSEAIKLPDDWLNPTQNVRQCEGPDDVDLGIMSFLDFDKYISEVGEGEDVGMVKCTVCGQISARKCNMRRHVENTHFRGMFEYSCADCEGKFDTKDGYFYHRKKHHCSR